MLGRASARLHAPPRRWLQAFWGVPDIDDRQKWSIIWPRLARLPKRGVRLLDAGCATGRWSLELAARRPMWTIVGVDSDADAIRAARASRRALGLGNVSFIRKDFFAYDGGPEPFDAIISVSSAHYLAERGEGVELFRRFREWLRPGGHVFLLGPRRAADCWFIPWLYRPAGHAVFSSEDLEDHCRRSALQVGAIEGCIGPLATVAKQTAWELQRRSPWLGRLAYPLLWTLSALDVRMRHRAARRTMMWLLTAHAGVPALGPQGSSPKRRHGKRRRRPVREA
jgi:SAM-dependent methyltransferase